MRNEIEKYAAEAGSVRREEEDNMLLVSSD
jgi:hypothetical protein